MNGRVDSQAILSVVALLDPILADGHVSEIMIDSYERILVDRGGQVEAVPSPFASPEELQALIDGLFGLYGIRLDASHPVGYLHLPDHTQVTAVVPPTAVEGPYLVLRKAARPPLTWEKLIEWGTVPQEGRDLLQRAVEARASILVAGGTAAGKMTMAARIAELCPAGERLILVEQAYEMLVSHPRLLRLEAGGPAGLTLEEVLKAAVNMRPDRLIVGELDGPVAASVLRLFGSGYDGSMAEIHGTSVEDALHRLETFCLMANLGLGLGEIRHLIAAGIRLITYQERMPDGHRKMIEIAELSGVENNRYVLQPLLRYDREAKCFALTGIRPSWERA